MKFLAVFLLIKYNFNHSKTFENTYSIFLDKLLLFLLSCCSREMPTNYYSTSFLYILHLIISWSGLGIHLLMRPNIA